MTDFRTAFAESFNPVKQELLVPQCGGTSLHVPVLKEVDRANPSGRTVWTLITDGEISSSEEALRFLPEWARRAGHSLVFVEIGKESSFGKELRKGAAPSIVCTRVNKVEEVRAVLGSILIRYGK